MIASVEFAKYIILCTQKINEQNDTHIQLGETKLQKLLYICDGFLLAADINIIQEHARAWNYGPVYPHVHTWMQKNPDAFTKTQDCTSEALSQITEVGAPPLVDMVINIYGTWTASSLSSWSHGPNSPWELALARGKGVMNSTIDKQDMKDYFQGLIRDHQ